METDDALLGRVNKLLDELAADKKKAKEKEASEAWTKPAAISVVVLAVLGATATQRGGSYSTRALKHLNAAIYHQVEASDQWAYFQAKSTKAHVFEQTVKEVQVLAPAGSPDAAKMIEGSVKKLKEYESDKEDASNKAKGFEKSRDEENALADANSGASSSLALAVTLLQVAVAITSICLVIKKKALWFAAMAIAVPAVVLMVQVLFVTAPAK